MLLVEEPETVAALVAAAAGSLEPRADGEWSWTHRLEFVLPDGGVVDAGLQLDGKGRFAWRRGGGPEQSCVLTPALRAAVRDVLTRAVERGALVANDALPTCLRPRP